MGRIDELQGDLAGALDTIECKLMGRIEERFEEWGHRTDSRMVTIRMLVGDASTRNRGL